MFDRYRQLKHVLRDEPLPAALVDLDAVERNIDTLLGPVRAKNKKLRIASKSIRCLDLIDHIIDRGGDTMAGVMSFAVREAEFLVANGHRDVFIAYPTLRTDDLECLAKLNADGAVVAIAVDDPEHVDRIDASGKARGTSIPVIVDVDMSLRLLGDRLHLGVRRSPLATADEVLRLARHIARCSNVRFHGVMGYEAQIAGVTDRSPFSPALNAPKRAIKHLSRGHIERTRREIDRRLRAEGFELTVFNGGGSGSLTWASEEDALTEVTAGSGFVDSHLFDYYRDLDLSPAIFFAIQIVRRPTAGVVTCHGGGYIASGEAGPDRLPRPYLPPGLSLLGLEGAGEVQTPLVVPRGVELELGDPVFFRHAKAGELAEHFDTYLFVRGDEIVHRAKTYRGAGQRFL